MDGMTTSSFPKEYLAFAISIVRSKPTHKSIREHILSLRKHITHQDGPSSDPVFHAAAFWKAEYEGARQQVLNLRKRVAELEADTDAEDDAPMPDDGPRRENGNIGGSLKRKQTGNAESCLPRKKRQRRKPTGAQHSESGPGSIGHVGRTRALDQTAGIGANELTTDYATDGLMADDVVTHIFLLARLLQRNDTNTARLAQQCIDTAFSLKDLVDRVHNGKNDDSSSVTRDLFAIGGVSTRQSDAKEALNVFARGAAVLSKAVMLLSPAVDAKKARKPEVIYAMNSIFREILVRFMSEAKDAGSIDLKRYHSWETRNMSQALLALMNNLQAGDPWHRDIFESFMALLLDTIGNQLFLSCFGHERQKTIEADIEASGKLRSPEFEAPRGVRDQLAHTSPLLVKVLEHAMKLAPGFLGGGSKKTGQKGAAARLKRSKTAMSLYQERLQQTLIKATFGTEVESEFWDCLQMPSRLATKSASLPMIKSDDVCEWFVGKVQHLIGWDVLSRQEW